MLANTIVTRFTPPLLAFCLALTLGNVPRGSAQSTLPPMPAAAAHSDNFLGNQFQLPGAALPAAAPTDPHVAALESKVDGILAARR